MGGVTNQKLRSIIPNIKKVAGNCFNKIAKYEK